VLSYPLSAVTPGSAVEGVIVTCIVAVLALVVIVIGFIRSDDLDDCDWNDEGYGTNFVAANASSDDGWLLPDETLIGGSGKTFSMNNDSLSGFDNDPRPGFDLAFAYDEMGELGANSIFHDSFSDSGSFTGSETIYD